MTMIAICSDSSQILPQVMEAWWRIPVYASVNWVIMGSGDDFPMPNEYLKQHWLIVN